LEMWYACEEAQLGKWLVNSNTDGLFVSGGEWNSLGFCEVGRIVTWLHWQGCLE
jgi:hypothetical protein